MRETLEPHDLRDSITEAFQGRYGSVPLVSESARAQSNYSVSSYSSFRSMAVITSFGCTSVGSTSGCLREYVPALTAAFGRSRARSASAGARRRACSYTASASGTGSARGDGQRLEHSRSHFLFSRERQHLRNFGCTTFGGTSLGCTSLGCTSSTEI